MIEDFLPDPGLCLIVYENDHIYHIKPSVHYTPEQLLEIYINLASQPRNQ